VITIEHLVAHKLYPKHRGANLDDQQMDDVKTYIFSQDWDFIPLVTGQQLSRIQSIASFVLPG